MRRMMNKDLPYEQQIKLILETYDKITEENSSLKKKIAVLENTLSMKEDRLRWIHVTLMDYLASTGIELPKNCTVSKIVKTLVERKS